MDWTKVGYQGEPGAFSEEAVRLLFPDAAAIAHRGLRTVFDDVASGGPRSAWSPSRSWPPGSKRTRGT